MDLYKYKGKHCISVQSDLKTSRCRCVAKQIYLQLKLNLVLRMKIMLPEKQQQHMLFYNTSNCCYFLACYNAVDLLFSLCAYEQN